MLLVCILALVLDATDALPPKSSPVTAGLRESESECAVGHLHILPD
jgi:hypothetical protein